MSKKKLVSVAVASLLALGGSLGLATSASAVATTVRVSGADRYETAVKVAFDKLTGNVTDVKTATKVYVASGEVYADALVAGPLAAVNSKDVLLLVQQNAIPASVTAALGTGKTNYQIVVLGGTGTVSSAVYEKLAAYATTGSISRIAGADRYETAAKVAQALVPDTELAGPTSAADINNDYTVFLASGEAYPDALSAAAIAGTVANANGVLLLTQGNSLPATTAAALLRLDTDKAGSGAGSTNKTDNDVIAVRVIGGTGSISDAVVTSVDNRIEINATTAADSPISRWAGADRYATSAKIVTENVGSSEAFVGSTNVFLASGENFPDALVSGQINSATPADTRPVLLVRAGEVPTSVCAALGSLPAAATVTAVGGTASISNATLAAAAACVDNAAPTITDTGFAEVQALGGTFSLAGLSAADTEDGVLTSQITYTAKKYPFFSFVSSAFDGTGTPVSSAIDMSVAGVYEVTFSVVDSKGLSAQLVVDNVAVVAKPSVSWNTTSAAIDDASDLRGQVVAKDWNGVAFTSNAAGENISGKAIFVTAVNATTGATIAVDSNGDMADQTVGTSVTLTYVVTDPQGGLKTTFTYTGVTK